MSFVPIPGRPDPRSTPPLDELVEILAAQATSHPRDVVEIRVHDRDQLALLNEWFGTASDRAIAEAENLALFGVPIYNVDDVPKGVARLVRRDRSTTDYRLR